MLTIDNYLDSHYIHRSNWLRAAVLGANDGIISISSLAIGVAAAFGMALAEIAGEDTDVSRFNVKVAVEISMVAVLLFPDKICQRTQKRKFRFPI